MTSSFARYPPIEAHAVIGDRRTAALVAADGTVDWLCSPTYDGDIVFGSLLDAGKGGFWRMGPATPVSGKQRYLPGTAVLRTEWQLPEGSLELTDAMLWPEDDRPSELSTAHAIVRSLHCTTGRVSVCSIMRPRFAFGSSPVSISTEKEKGFLLKFKDTTFSILTTIPLEETEQGLQGKIDLCKGETIWGVFGVDDSEQLWNDERLEMALQQTVAYWSTWSNSLNIHEQDRHLVLRTAVTIHLLTFAPAGSAVAAATTSLPERIGGDWNADYRFAWVRDTSLALAFLALLGKGDEVSRYLEWLAKREADTGRPLQVMYRADGHRELDPHEYWNLEGYRQSRPVKSGNHAYRQHQHGSVGYLADCTLIYLDHGGLWKEEYWHLIKRVADYTARVWMEPDNGVWELAEPTHWVSSKVMSWVVLDRAIRIAAKVGREIEARDWPQTKDEIRQEILSRGWNEKTGSFRQHYDSEDVDGALLLIPVMEFLPADDQRVIGTMEKIEHDLTINGFVHRFLPRNTPGIDTDLPLGKYEGAFFPTTFWLATAYAKRGMVERAEAILHRCEERAGGPGLFAEGVNAFTGHYLGNTPLLFSQVEYARARMEVERRKLSGGMTP